MTHESRQPDELTENPNPGATIGFVLYYPFQFYVYKNIYKQLEAEAEFIVDLGVYRPVHQPQELIDDIISLLKKEGVSYRILGYHDYVYSSYLQNFFGQYQALVSVWERGCMVLKETRHIKKINAVYGAGKELTAVRPSQGLYDICLVYGERMARLHNLFSNSVVVGNPKFDDWFNNTFDHALLQEVQARLDPRKKTILYLPTHSDLSSIDQLSGELKKITKDYNVIVKMHYYTSREEPERARSLKYPGITLLEDYVDVLPLLKIADVVVSDNSSAIFDAVLADKPVVVSDFWDEEFLDTEHKTRKRYRRGTAGALTYSKSIEQVVKREGWVLTIKRAEELEGKIKEALHETDYFPLKREDLRHELFGFTDGHCAERAADAIRACIANPHSSERPILFHAFEVHRAASGWMSRGKEQELNEKIATYESLLTERIVSSTETFFSVVLLDSEGSSSEMKKESLRALFSQTFPHENYEIIICNSSGTGISGVQGSDTPPSLRYIPKQDDGGFAFIKEAVDVARGEVICFTRDSCRASTGWLQEFYVAYQKNPEVVGVGGFEIKGSNIHTIFDEYYFLELGKKLGIEKEMPYSKLYSVKNSLLYQNPIGTLSNVSYKKEVLQKMNIDYEKIPFVELLEMMMKKEALAENKPVYFIPYSVENLSELDLKKFIKRNFREGLIYYMLCLPIPRLKKYYGYSIFSIIKLPLTNIFGKSFKAKLFFAAVTFVGTLFRWLGGVYGFLVMIKNRIDHSIIRGSS